MSNKVNSNIFPRTDDDSAQLKSENVNLSLKNMCNQYDHVTFSDQDGAFRLSDESVNDALLLGDGLHPNYKGTQKLINTVKIKNQLSIVIKNQLPIRITTQIPITVLQVIHHFYPSLSCSAKTTAIEPINHFLYKLQTFRS